MKKSFIEHNSQNKYYREPFGAVPLGSNINISILSEKVDEIYLIGIDTGSIEYKIPMEEDIIYENKKIKYTANLYLSEKQGLIYYYFLIKNQENYFYYGNNEENLGGLGQVYETIDNLKSYQITIYKPWKIADWYKEGIVYQIFVDRFFNGNIDGNIDNPKKNSFIYGSWYDKPMYIKDNGGRVVRWDFFGGNLKGIIKKLDYLKELRITAIYLNPIFESVSCHKYDTGDYEKIDPMFGDEEILKALCKEGQKRGIGIILDGVFSHTGSDSKYFNKEGNYNSIGAYNSQDSIYYQWYKFSNFPNEYECWWNFNNQPNVNELDESYLNYIIRSENSVIKKWMRLGVKGWRLDVADELPDEFIEEFKVTIENQDKDGVLIGEVWEDGTNKISYGKRRQYALGHELDSITNYPFREIIISFLLGNIDGFILRRKLMNLRENYPKEMFFSLMNLIGTHDTERALTIFTNYNNINRGNKSIAKRLLMIALAFQMTFPGVPLIYYGDEVGIEGEKDPDNRRTYPWGKEDIEILNWYKKLCYIRSDNEVLKKGDIEFIDSNDNDLLIFKRIYKSTEAIIVINRGVSEKYIELNLKNKYAVNLINNKYIEADKNNKVKLHLFEFEVIILL